MATLSLHHHTLTLSPETSLARNTTTSTTSATTATTTRNTANPNQTHPCLVLLEKCTTMSRLKQIHAQMVRNGLFFNDFAAAKIVAFCALQDSGSLHYARLVFTQITNPTTYTCNSIIRGYTNQNLPDEAILFYQEMIIQGLQPDRFTFPSLFKSCRTMCEGKQFHCHSTKLGFAQDLYIQNTLMNMYALCGCLISAQKVFDKIVDRNVVSWATMIAAYTQGEQPSEAIKLFTRMEAENVSPNEVLLINVLNACARARDLETAKRVHKYIDEEGIGFHLVLNAALMDVYCKCGCVSLARSLFENMPKKNLFCWNIMIRGHVEDGDHAEALLLFREMQLQGVKGDKMTMVSLLLACAHLGAFELGMWLHIYIEREKIEADVALGTALVDMYTKFGSLESALRVFHEMPEKDVMTWTALIVGLAMCGEGCKALQYFKEMQMNGVKPDAIMFVGVLAACSHAGLVDEGISHFNSMSDMYGIQPSVEHYGCIVDMLGREGDIAKAEELVQSMPMAPDEFVLRGLLSAYRINGNLEAAEPVAQKLLELDPNNGGTYMLLANIYSSLKKWEEAKRIRKLVVERNIKPIPDWSLIEVDGIVHEFPKGDRSHAEASKTYEMLNDMMNRLESAGYVAEQSKSFEVDEEEMEDALGPHSEKLAIAFGLIRTSPGTAIRVVKNVSVCSDCHSAIKFISKAYNREIIIRDGNRFHRFKDGTCSCRDFWG